MLVLDFINVGNGDSALIREMEEGRQVFAMLVDCGHDCLVRDDHPPLNDQRSCRIYAGDFLKKQGVTHLDVLLLTHFHRDHIGGLGRVLEAVTVGERRGTAFPWSRTGTMACPRLPGTCCGAWICMPGPCGSIRAASAP